MEDEWQAVKDAQTYPFDEFRREMGWDALPKRAVTEKREDIVKSILAIQQTYKMFQRVFESALSGHLHEGTRRNPCDIPRFAGMHILGPGRPPGHRSRPDSADPASVGNEAG